MSDELKHSDLIEKDALKKIKRETKAAKLEFQRLERAIVSLLGKSSKLAKSLSTPKNIKEIRAQDDAIKNIDKSTDALIATRKKMQTLDKQIEKDRLAEIRLDKAREKAFDDFEKKQKKGIKTKEQQRLAEIKLSKARDDAFKKSDSQSKREVANAEKERLAEIKLSTDRDRAFDKADRQQKKTQANALKVKKANLDSADAYKQLNKQVKTARARARRLEVQYGRNAKITQQATRRYDRLNTKLKQVNRTARSGTGLFSKLGGALSKGAGAAGIAIGATAVVAAIGNMIGIFKDFDKASSNLEAILGATGSEMDLLRTSAKNLGSTTAFTASEVLGLQTEFAKLGFDVTEIDNATASTLALASASDTELAEAAAVVGATLGGFGKDAKETARFTDVMAKSFSSSALDMEKFKESMKTAAPAARAVGLSVEKTTALLGTMANAGISGSKAGNNLKTSLIKLNAAGLTLNEGLQKVAKSEDKLGEAAKLVGLNAAASFLVLAEGVDVTDRLETSLLGAEGAAQRMADVQLDNLAGDVTILGSAWEGFILSIEDGQGVLGKFVRFGIKQVTSIISLFTQQNSVIEKTVDSLKKEQDALFNLSSQILEVNIDSGERNELLNELNELYPDILRNIDTETVSYKELKKVLSEANKTLSTRIQIQEALIDVESTIAGIAETKAKIDRNEIAILKEATIVLRKRNGEEELLGLTLSEKIKLAQKELDFTSSINLLAIQRIGLLELQEHLEGKLVERREISNSVITALLSGTTKLNELTTKELQNLLSGNQLTDEQLRFKAELIVRFRLLNIEKAEALALDEKLKNAESDLVEVETDLIKIQLALLKTARETNAVNEEQQAARNIRIAGIQDEIRRLRELGIERDKERDRLKPLEQKSGVDPAVLNAIEQERLARGLLGVERARQDSERIFRTKEVAANEIKDAAERDAALFAISQGRLSAEMGFLQIESDLKRHALEANFRFTIETEERLALEEILITIETERKKALIKADSIKNDQDRANEIARINEQARIDSKAATIESNNKIALETEKHHNDVIALGLELSRSQQALLDQKVDNEAAANAKIIADEKAANEKRLRENVKLFNKIVNNTKSELRKINDLKNQEANEEIRLAEESVRQQQAIAAAGGNAIIGEEKARLAKLRLERKRELEAQARQERNIALAQNFVNSLAAHSKDDPTSAFAKASFETLAGGAFAKLLAGFAEGGYTGDGGKYDVAGLVHAGENVNTADQVTKYNMKGWSAKDFDRKVEEGHFNQYSDTDLSPSQYKQLEVSNMIQQPNNVNLMPMIMEQQKSTATLKKAIEDNRSVYELGLNVMNEFVERETRNNVTKMTTHKKSQL